ncbi:hypothetical protein [Ferruginibacter sp. SUN106]|uniref:hypothetical protein n=1 Tax=Ferruginibacter sp. SUN106 TaxID=2978348 RepID=UPI003D36F152
MNWTKYLPVENYTLATKLSVQEVRNRIEDNIGAKEQYSLFSFKNNITKPYVGQLKGNTFTINRVINYRNSFLPIIKGEISEFTGQPRIHIKMRPATMVLVFISAWLGIAGITCLIMLFTVVVQSREIMQHGISPVMLGPFAMFCFGYLLTYFAFKLESKKSKEFLQNLFVAEEVNDQ